MCFPIATKTKNASQEFCAWMFALFVSIIDHYYDWHVWGWRLPWRHRNTKCLAFARKWRRGTLSVYSFFVLALAPHSLSLSFLSRGSFINHLTLHLRCHICHTFSFLPRCSPCFWPCLYISLSDFICSSDTQSPLCNPSASPFPSHLFTISPYFTGLTECI